MTLITLADLLLGSAASLVLLFIAQVVWNVRFHPLNKIPGSRLAIASGWYEAYHEFWKSQSGQYIHEIDRQHNLHVFGSILHETHHVRRSALNPFFSRASIIRLEPLLRQHVQSLCETIGQLGQGGNVIQLRHAMIAVTIDVISEHVFGEPVGASGSPESWPKWEAMMSGIAEGVPAAKCFPIIYTLLLRLPRSCAKTLSQALADYLDYIDVIRSKVREVLALHRMDTQLHLADVKPPEHPRQVNAPPNIFTEVLHSNLPDIEKSEERLIQEAVGIVSAGSETTSLTIATTIFHVLQQPELLSSIREELRTVMPTRHASIDWLQLERLPMLTAIVKEGLRISTSICGRLPVVLDVEIQYQGYRIPPRTPISMSPRDALMDPDIFVEPTTFNPRRWFETNAAHRALMDKAFVPFSQGPRMCIGLNLAHAKMYHILSCVLARFELELVDTLRERDVDLCRDCFVPKPRQESKGIRVRVVKQYGVHW